MSGTTRNVSIRLSVEGAEIVRRALQETGEQGQRALTTLDTATQRAAGQMVALRTNTEQAARSGTNFNQVIGQAGFQIGDFATQVQAGGSALTAFSQQAGQFLGAFGTGGAIAGAVLTVGILATQFLNTGNNAEDAKKGIDAFAEATQRAARDAAELVTFLDRVSGRFVSITQRQRVQQQRELNVDIARLGNDANQALLDQLGARRDATLARNQAASLRGVLDTENDPTRVTGIGLRERQAIEREIQEAENRAASLERDAAALDARIRRLDFERQRTEGLLTGLVADASGDANLGPNDPPAREGGGGGRAAREEDLGAGFDRSEKLAQREAQRALAAGNRVKNLREETERASDVARELGLTFSSAFEDAVVKGNDLRAVLQGLVQDVSRIVVRKAVTEPLGNAFSSQLSGGFPALFGASGGGKGADFLAATSGSFGTFTGSVKTNANGNAFGGDGLIPFARGGIVNRPTVFPFARGIGLMGEAGPEAIMPLKRGPDGKLGVAGGGGGQVVNVTIMAQDAGSFFGKNGRQVTRELAAAVDRGRR